VTQQTSFLRLQARTSRFTAGTPKNFQVSPDGARVLFLRSESGESRQQSLWQLDVASGKEIRLADPEELLTTAEELSVEERARRERARTRAAGIVSYATDTEMYSAVFALSGRLFRTDLDTGQTQELSTPTPVIDPRQDPTGQRVAYVANNALRVINADGTDDRALAEPAGKNEAYGLAEFIAAEEMGRHRGYWWSPVGDRLLVAHTDTSPVQRWRSLHVHNYRHGSPRRGCQHNGVQYRHRQLHDAFS